MPKEAWKAISHRAKHFPDIRTYYRVKHKLYAAVKRIQTPAALQMEAGDDIDAEYWVFRARLGASLQILMSKLAGVVQDTFEACESEAATWSLIEDRLWTDFAPPTVHMDPITESADQIPLASHHYSGSGAQSVGDTSRNVNSGEDAALNDHQDLRHGYLYEDSVPPNIERMMAYISDQRLQRGRGSMVTTPQWPFTPLQHDHQGYIDPSVLQFRSQRPPQVFQAFPPLSYTSDTQLNHMTAAPVNASHASSFSPAQLSWPSLPCQQPPQSFVNPSNSDTDNIFPSPS